MFSLQCLVHKFPHFNTPELLNGISAVSRWLLTASSLSFAHFSRTHFRFICVSNTYSSVCRIAVYSNVCVYPWTSLYSMWGQEISAKCLPQSLSLRKGFSLPGASPAPVSQCWIIRVHCTPGYVVSIWTQPYAGEEVLYQLSHLLRKEASSWCN